MESSLTMERLQQAGFENLFIKECLPNEHFPSHTHELDTVHVILSGEVALIEPSHTLLLKEGDHHVIPGGTTHEAHAGPAGCRFIAGTRPSTVHQS